VIIAMHHEQDLRRMGGLAKVMPVTWATALVGSLALAGIPPFAGRFSKDASMRAVHFSQMPGHGYAYFAVLSGVFITAFYSFRMLFLAFHGKPRWGEHDGHAADEHDHGHDAGDEPDAHEHQGGPPKESPWVVTLPLILLAIPSLVAGWIYVEPMLFGTYFGEAIVVRQEHAVLAELGKDWHGVAAFIQHGFLSPPFWLALAGIVAAWYLYLVNPALPERLRRAAGPLYTLLDNKYYFDRFNAFVFAGGARRLGAFLSEVGDRAIIDGFFVNGSAKVVGWASALLRHLQSGYVYHYAFTMIVGVVALLAWFHR
jgi:NADH-quinone oxidoreductase subunit L